MADEPIEAIAGSDTPPPDASRRCEFCGSALTAKGEVLSMSQRARELRNLADDLAREKSAHASTQTQLQQARERVAELERQQADAGRGPKETRYGTFK
jgi:hypothetical protein